MNTTCKPFAPLIPAYLDGELSDAQAGPLRRHLLECPACRREVAGEKALKRWFVAEPVPAVPVGFADRVARRAFAGDPGLEASAPRSADEGRILPFVLTLTAAAAALLLIVAGSIHGLIVPAGGTLGAEDDVPMKLEQVLGELERLERAEASGAGVKDAAEERSEPTRPRGTPGR